MSKLNYLTIDNLRKEIIKLGGAERLPKKGSGSGKNGNIIKQDLLKVYNSLLSTKKSTKLVWKETKKPEEKKLITKKTILPKDITGLLYADIWTTIIKSLDVEDIINLCSANKELEEKICENHNYWTARLKEDFNIPNEAVNLKQPEYKNKTPFQVYVFITKKYKKVDISNKKLKEWPQELKGFEWAIKQLYCDNNRLTALPDLPNCEILYCDYNKLTALPDLPNCMMLHCYNNQLTALPDLPKIVIFRGETI